MDAAISERRGETEAHHRLKRLSLLWAQGHGYSACGFEVSLPQCRFRADVAGYRPGEDGSGVTAVFECKQALPDLRKDNCSTAPALERLKALNSRRSVLEKHLRIHYPALRVRDSLFAEYDSHDFHAIPHRAYARVLRELGALQNRLHRGTKFESLARYRCANLFFLVLPGDLYCEAELPAGWGVLVAEKNALSLARKPIWQENSPAQRLRFLERIARAGTRQLNRQLEISFDDILSARRTTL